MQRTGAAHPRGRRRERVRCAEAAAFQPLRGVLAEFRLPLCALLVVAACWWVSDGLSTPAAAAIADHRRDIDGPWRVRGILATDPERQDRSWAVDLDVEAMRVDGVWRTWPLRVRATVYDPRPRTEWHAGHGFEAILALRRSHAARNPMVRPPPPLAAFGIDVRSSLKSFRQLRRRPPTAPRFTSIVRAALRDALHRRLGVDAPLAQALLLGERGGVAGDLRQSMARTGLIHLLAVSGLHVGLMVGAIFACVRFAGVSRPTAAMATLIAGVPMVIALVAPRPSVTRAAIMAAIVLIGISIGRRTRGLDALAIAVCIVCVLTPAVVRNPGFQFSVLATAAILVTLPRRRHQTAIAKALATVSMSAAAQIAVTPVLAGSAFRFTPFSPWLNLIAIPAMAVALLASWATSLCDAAGVEACAASAAAVTRVVLQSSSTAAAVADRLLTPTAIPSIAQSAVAAVAICALVAAAAVTRHQGRPHLAPALLGAGIAGIAACAVIFAPTNRPDDLVLVALDVGQGDAILVESPHGALLVDTGGGTPEYDAGIRVLAPSLRARGVERLDIVALTHLHADHTGGFAGLAREIDIREVWLPPGSAAALEPRVRAAIRGAIQTPRAGDTFRWGGCTLRVLHPDGDPANATVNDTSLVIALRCAGRDFLLTGDSETPAESTYRRRLRSAGGTLKAPHHGSSTSSTAALLDTMRPRHVIVSAGWNNRFGHPAADVLERYRSRQVAVYRTDRDGAVTLRAGRRVRVSAPRWTSGRGAHRVGGWRF